MSPHSDSNEKSENGSGSGKSSSVIGSSYTSGGENSSSMKESDNMSYENETETGSKLDKIFIPVKKSADHLRKAPFWMESLSSSFGLPQNCSLYKNSYGADDLQKHMENNHPKGVLEQLQELIAEMHCRSNGEDERKVPEYDFTSEVKEYFLSNVRTTAMLTQSWRL